MKSMLMAIGEDKWKVGFWISVAFIVTAVGLSVSRYYHATTLLGADYWEHAAALRALLGDPVEPGAPHVSGEHGSARYMPYYLALAMVGRVFNMDAHQVMGLAAIVSTILFGSGVYVFSLRYFKDRRAPLFTLAVLLGGWGVAWLWSNVYQLRDLLYVAAFPSFFVFALTFYILYIVVAALENSARNTDRYIWLVFASSLALVSHPLTGIFALFFAAVVAGLHGAAQTRVRVQLVAAISLGAVLVEVWPYFSTWGVILGKSGGGGDSSWVQSLKIEDISRAKQLYWGHPFYSPSQVLVALGPALLGFPALLWLALRRQRVELLVSAGAMFAVYVANLVFHVPLGHRALLLGMLPLHLAMVAFLLYLSEGRGGGPAKRRRYGAYVFIIGMVSFNVLLMAVEFLGYRVVPGIEVRRINPDGELPIREEYQRVARHLTEESVVMAPERISWPLPAFQGKVVAEHHSNPLTPDGGARRRDVKEFFSVEASLDLRMEFLRKYGATHVLFAPDSTDELLRAELDMLPGIRHRVGKFVLIALN